MYACSAVQAPCLVQVFFQVKQGRFEGRYSIVLVATFESMLKPINFMGRLPIAVRTLSLLGKRYPSIAYNTNFRICTPTFNRSHCHVTA